MTVPGKGGRPRKWRSDADRVRAFRARQRGQDEPATLDVALESGDEAAVAWETVRALGAELEAIRAEMKAAISAAREADRQSAADLKRFAWISTENDRLRHELDAVTVERDALRRQLEQALLASQSSETVSPPIAPTPNRAQRRRDERERRRRQGGTTER